jgi:hypothetical protein
MDDGFLGIDGGVLGDREGDRPKDRPKIGQHSKIDSG